MNLPVKLMTKLSFFTKQNELNRILNKCSFFKEITHIDMDVSVLVIAALNGLFILFLYCFFGKLAMVSFLEMGNSLFESNWQNLPVELQKYITLIIGNAQEPIFYHGFQVVILDLETYTKVS